LLALQHAGCGMMGSSFVLKYNPDFFPKTHMGTKGCTALDPLVIPALSDYVAPTMTEDKLLCPVRALKWYLKRTEKHREGKRRFLIAYKQGYKQDIAAPTVSRWIKEVVIRAYRKATPDAKQIYYPDTVPHAHQLRGIAASWAVAHRVSMDEILRACSWKSSTTFTSFYLRDMTLVSNNLSKLGPLVAAQNVVG
jgi:hypothetical protein